MTIIYMNRIKVRLPYLFGVIRSLLHMDNEEIKATVTIHIRYLQA